MGVEMVQAFAGFGTAVTIVRTADRLPPGEGSGPAEKVAAERRGRAPACR